MTRLGIVFFRAILLLYPSSMRKRHGRDAVETFEARQREAAHRGKIALVGFWWRELGAAATDAATLVLEGARLERSPRRRAAERVHDLSSDFRYAVRKISKSPIYALAVVATLALGIGANTAVLSLIHAITLQTLPFENAERMLEMSASHPGNDSGGNSISFREMADVAERSQTLERIEPFMDWLNVTVVDEESSQSLLASFVSHRYFSLVAGDTAVGRFYSAEEDRFGAATPVVVLSHRVWHNAYAASPDVVGRRIRVNDVEATVVGVMSADFHDLNSHWSDGTDLWMPIFSIDTVMGRSYLESRTSRSMNGIALLKPGVTADVALDEMHAIAAQLEREFPDTQTGYGIHVEPIRESFFGELQRPSLLAWAAAALVLLITAANVAGLLLVRGLERRREIAARTVLGATRRRLLSMLLMEPFVLGLVGLVSGLVFAELLIVWFVHSEVVHLPAFLALDLDPIVFAVSTAIAVLVIALFSLAPMWVTHRVNLRDALASGGKGTSEGGHVGMRSGLIVFEIALATSLLIVAMMTIASFWRLQRTDLGYDAENLVTLRFDLRTERNQSREGKVLFAESLRRELESRAGVASAILWGPNMLGRGYINASLEDVEKPALTPADYYRAGRHHVGAGGLSALGMTLSAGREFTSADTVGAPDVVILSETLAGRLWRDESAIGKRVRFFDVELEVVGVARDAVHRPRFVGDDEIYAVSDLQDVYLPYTQYPQQRSVLLIRTSGEASSLNVAELVARIVKDIDPEVPVYDIETMARRLERDDALSEFTGELMGGFASIALVLSVIGIYGLLQFLVQLRYNELGIRMSIGARPTNIAELILRQAVVVATLGIVFGVAGGALLSRLIVSLLYEVDPFDGSLFVSAGVILFVTALLAASFPAMRAARIDPVTALRSE